MIKLIPDTQNKDSVPLLDEIEPKKSVLNLTTISQSKEGIAVKFKLDMPNDYTFTKIEYGDGNWSDSLNSYKYTNSGTFEIKVYASDGKGDIEAVSEIEILKRAYKQVVEIKNEIPTKLSYGFVQVVKIKKDSLTSRTNKTQHVLIATQNEKVGDSSTAITSPIRTYPLEGEYYNVGLGITFWKGFNLNQEVEMKYFIYGD